MKSTDRHPSRHYLECARRLRQLQELMQAGEGDSEAADELRDQMDIDWKLMGDEERGWTGELSADLYILGENGPLSGDQPTESPIRRRMLVAGRAEDWAGLRSLLDSDAGSADLFDRILFRAIYWAAMKDYDSSLDFLGFLARRVDVYRTLIEKAQSEFSRLARAGRAAGEIAVVQEDGRHILERLALIAEELGRLISDVEAMRPSATAPEVSPSAWIAFKERLLRIEAPLPANPELAA